MNNLEMIGRIILVGGIALVVVGGLIWLVSRLTGWSQLPGTLKIQGAGFTCIIPILGSIVLSIVLTLVLNLLARLLNK